MKDGDMPKKYDPEFKARAVRLVRDHMDDYGSVTAASVAVGTQLGVARETLRRWVAQADVDDGARPGVTTAEAEEIRRLKAENKRLAEANAILRSASIFFAGELDSRNR
jgi:transposase-like protein